MNTTVLQNRSIARLERLGFALTNAYPDGYDGEYLCIVMVRGDYGRPGCAQVEIDADGSCSGDDVDAYVNRLSFAR